MKIREKTVLIKRHVEKIEQGLKENRYADYSNNLKEIVARCKADVKERSLHRANGFNASETEELYQAIICFDPEVTDLSLNDGFTINRILSILKKKSRK